MVLGMSTLKELDVSRCLKVTDIGLKHLLCIPNLEKLSVSETAVTSEGVTGLSSLTNLSILDLGGLPVTDQTLCSLQVCCFNCICLVQLRCSFMFIQLILYL